MEGHGEAVEDEGVSRAGAERTELVMQQAQSQRGGRWEAGGCGDRGRPGSAPQEPAPLSPAPRPVPALTVPGRGGRGHILPP